MAKERTPDEMVALLARHTGEYPAPFGHGHSGWLTDLRRTPLHPVTQCRCHEGRVTDREGKFVRWMPSTHECDYVLERDALGGDNYALAMLAGLRAGASLARMARAGNGYHKEMRS